MHSHPMHSRRPARLIVCGALGRMGARVLDLARGDARFKPVAGVVRRLPTAPGVFSPVPLITEAELPRHLSLTDVLIDFSIPEASVRFAEAAAKFAKPVVIGATGFSRGQRAALLRRSKKTAVFLSPNFSPGMNLLFHLARRAGAALPGYDACVSEIHHAQKKDAPSGTALRLAEAAESGRKESRPRPEQPKPIPIVSQRAGTVVGEHTLVLAGPAERLELTHRAESRDAFARGALEAARWILDDRGGRPGLYDMEQMLGLK